MVLVVMVLLLFISVEFIVTMVALVRLLRFADGGYKSTVVAIHTLSKWFNQ